MTVRGYRSRKDAFGIRGLIRIDNSQFTIHYSLFAILFLSYLLHCPLLTAQSQEVIPNIHADTLSFQSDTTSTLKQEYKPFTPTKSALLAVGLSAALPGAGQFYNETYWKVPVIWGLGGYWIYEWVKLNDEYQNYRTLYSQSVEANPNGIENYKLNRDRFRDERDKFAWYLGVLYFVNVIDAYVGANLYDFEVTPDLGSDGRVLPRVTASIKLKF
ncbi:MAG: hypothetical protein HY960_08945 [Ignavibacteriae bacterium]|nr:hypothetical protein [Ignavibacteriota bacterium]